MKSGLAGKIDFVIVVGTLFCASIVLAQPAAGPLDIQGLDQFSVAGVRSRAMGGTAIANANDASALFSNPAALSRLNSFEIRMSGLLGNTARQQTQEWVPYMSNPGLSVLFESLTGTIPTAMDSLGTPLSGWKAVQRQYDNIGPNWNRSSSGVQPLSLAAALPLTIAGISMTAAIGAAQAMNLDHYYQNNNALSPYLGQLRPDPKTITKPMDTVNAQWYKYIRERKGIVYGITPGISISLLQGLTVGASATVLTGSSDDNEQRVERGHLYVATNNKATANDFMLDTVYYQQSKTGTSSYTGKMFAVGFLLQQDRYSIGVTIKPSYTLTRSWEREVTSLDTTRKSFPVRIDSLTTRSYHESGKENLNFPLAYSFGIILTPTDKWTIAFDYEVRGLANMELTGSTFTSSSHPWVNNYGIMRFGAEYRPGSMIALRGGYHEDIQSFSPDGSAVIDEPARGGIYSLGAGIVFDNILIDLAYEYSLLKYEDIYQSNVNYNKKEQHRFMVELAYRF
ncbi:MAG: hypothetical protein NTV54_02780 [Ignavibacteriales bacterium]|nr:hypothetical protein [Ignavibacteriales bacterium]